MQHKAETPDLREKPEALNSFAVLKVNWDEREHDYIENFVPFVADCLRDAQKESVSLAEIQDLLSARLRFEVPQGAIKTILKRAASRGLVKRNKGSYWPNFEALTDLQIDKGGRRIDRQINALVSKFLDFCREEIGVVRTEDEATVALSDYVRQFAVPVLSIAVRGQDQFEDSEMLADVEYEVQRFVRHLEKNDPEGFDYLEDMAKGSMLASVLLYDDISEATRQFENLSVYLDTPFLVPLLGVNGEENAKPRRKLLGLLRQHRVKLCCFEDTFDELHSVLEGIEGSLRNGSSQSIKNTTDANLTASDLRRISGSLKSNLGGFNISIKERPPLTNHLSLDEEALDNTLQKVIGYKRDTTREHDVNALASIYRLRRGRKMTRLESSEAVFLTDNTGLARAAHEYFGGRNMSSPRAPICILEHDIATRVWLKSPAQAQNLPRQQMVAMSLVALKPSDGLWEKYLDEIERLKDKGKITEDEYLGMRFSQEASEALTDATRNDDNNFSEETIDEVLARLNRKAQEEPLNQFHKEREKTKEERSRRKNVEQKLSNMEQQLSVALEKSERDRSKLAVIVKRQADKAENQIDLSVYSIAGIALGLIAYFSFSHWDLIAPLQFILSLLTAALSFIVGKSLKMEQYVTPFRNWLRDRKVRRTVKFLNDMGLSSTHSKRQAIRHFQNTFSD